MFQPSTTQEVLQSKRCYQFQTYGRPFVKRERKIWENLPLHAAARDKPKTLAKPELDLVQLLIKCRPFRTYKGIENIGAQSMATASISTMGRAVRARFKYQKGK